MQWRSYQLWQMCRAKFSGEILVVNQLKGHTFSKATGRQHSPREHADPFDHVIMHLRQSSFLAVCH